MTPNIEPTPQDPREADDTNGDTQVPAAPESTDDQDRPVDNPSGG